MVCHTDDDWKRRRTNRRTKIYAATDDMRKKLFHTAGDLLEAKGKHKIQQEVLFPGYVFVQTQAPETLFYQLKKVPKLSKLLSDGEEEFLPVREDEQEFLESLITVEEKDGKEVYLVKRSEIQVDEEGNIVWAGTPLSRYIGNVVRKRIRKRYVVIEKELFGKKRTVLLSVRLKGEE